MDSRKIILLVGALFVAGITAFMARSLLSGASAPQATAATTPVIDGPQVLVATRALPVGTILDATAFKFQPWPKDLVQDAYFLQKTTDIKTLQGTVVRTAITAGQPITQGSLVKPGDRGFLAAALGPGMRAVTVPVSTQSSVAGFVFPGDRVDLVLTQSVSGGGDGPPLKAAETVLRNLRVLATDQRTDNQVDENGKTVVKTFSTVTVEVTPKIADQIAVAQTVGTLSLSLRSLADDGTQMQQMLAGSTGKAANGAANTGAMQLASEPEGRDPSFVTGADVSRFQRSTVPGKPGDVTGGVPPQGGSAAAAPGAPNGPVVRVARGTSVTIVPVGGNH
jgi:pilus assembly protein CpaB